MSLYFRLAWRNIWRHKRRTLIVVISIAFTLALMIFYDGLVMGFEDAVYGNAIKILGGNIQVHARGYQAETGTYPLIPLPETDSLLAAAREIEGVDSASLRIVTGGLVSSRAGALGVQIMGVDPVAEASFSLIPQNITSGRYLQAQDADVAVIGKGMADELDVGEGDKLTLSGRGMHEQTSQRTIVVVGVYDLQMADMEKQTVYISLAQAQGMFGLEGQAGEAVIQMKHLGDEERVISQLRAKLPDQFEYTTWKQSYPELQRALGMKGEVMMIFGVVMMAIAGIGILNILLMAVYERTREIGVLAALGMKPAPIAFNFLLEGFFMGLVGLAAGILLGLGLNLWLRQVGLDYSQFSGGGSFFALLSTRIYPSLGLQHISSRALIVLVISVLSALIPAREAARQEPAKALHFV